MLPRFSLLFDLDGTLVDSDALRLLAFAEILEGSGRTIDKCYYRAHIAGRPNDRVIAEAFPGASERERQALAARKEALYRASLMNIRPVTGAADILQWPKDARIRCAVVTTAPRASVEAVLQSTGLAGFFDLLVVGDEVARGKPDPLPYRTALLHFGIDPGDAVAFEDSLPGITSATGAGVSTVGMLASLTEAALVEAGVVRTASDFHDEGVRRWLLALAASS